MLPSSREPATDPAPLRALHGARSSGPGHSGRSPATRLGPDDTGVSEVVGFMLVFGIISLILVIAMVAFANAQRDAQANVQALQAEAVADRIAGLVVKAALFAERHDPGGDGIATFSYRLDLPQQLEGSEYTIGFVDGSDLDTSLDSVRLTMVSRGLVASAQLFQAGAGADAPICSPQPAIAGGEIRVAYGDHDGVDTAASPPCIFLEAIP